jgi:hypothetical protein
VARGTAMLEEAPILYDACCSVCPHRRRW